MTDLLLVALACTQIPIIFIFTSHTGLRLAHYYCQKRNPDWVAAHPEFKRHSIINTTARGMAWLIAAVSVVAIIKYVFIMPTSTYYALLLIAPLTIWVSCYLVYISIFYLTVTRKIPAPKRRQASLADRRLSAFVPLWIVYLCYAMLALILASNAWALLSEAHDTVLSVKRLLAFTVAIILGSGVLIVSLQRKNSEMEHVLGAGGRRLEVIASIVVLYLIVLVGGYFLLHDFFNISYFSDASLLVVISLLIQAYFLAYCLHPRVRTSLRNSLKTIHTPSK